VHVNVTVLALIAVALKVTVNTLDANTEDAGSAVPAGAVNLQTGVAGHEKPVKVVRIFPDAGIADGVVPVIVTVTPVDKAAVLLNVTAAPEMEPSIAGRVHSTVESIEAPFEYFVII